MVDAGGGADLLHADAVDLHAGERGIGVNGVGARAAHIGGGLVVEDHVAEALVLVAVFIREIDHGLAILERHPTHGAGETAELGAGALTPRFVFAADGVEADGDARLAQRLVHIHRIALAAPVVGAHLGGSLALRVRALGGDVDDTADIDIAKRETARAARELDALGVVDVLWHIPRKAVAQLAARRHAAKADLVA